ncbi:uncharacterized protein P174DRAFT_424060 [Aspergillus novofumigatus IBT 16806]|uniref:LysM domain-containing protein n=1 Tax=Aspergillus novofumigatus (strain IBT 16806) TaxID=1392255 RepID=A0A2I1C0V5_ASPN1|nr:uncharacterized protein P174DRAFT_424060 [Aspergillus novofumigatus IBT 16806]PKX91225.1 hypothetical protein P174DRAFT_424060 [Aspergillus novofumigatus IBT 16806]
MLKPVPWAILLRSSNSRLEPDYDHDHVKLPDRTGTHAQWNYRKLLRGKWYVVQSGDYCAKTEPVYGITMAQLQQWNPDLKDDCSNLQLEPLAE